MVAVTLQGKSDQRSAVCSPEGSGLFRFRCFQADSEQRQWANWNLGHLCCGWIGWSNQQYVAVPSGGGSQPTDCGPIRSVPYRIFEQKGDMCIGTYKGVLDAFSQISRKEGVGGFYIGIGPSVAAILPEAAIVYGLFDLSQKAYKNFTGREPGIMQSLSFGVWSAFMGQVVAYPLETISRRMQVQGMKGGQIGFVSCAKEIIRNDGLAGLYRGLGAASARVIPMAIASFGTYELVRRLVKEAEDAVDRAKARQEYNAHHCCSHVSAVTS